MTTQFKRSFARAAHFMEKKKVKGDEEWHIVMIRGQTKGEVGPSVLCISIGKERTSQSFGDKILYCSVDLDLGRVLLI